MKDRQAQRSSKLFTLLWPVPAILLISGLVLALPEGSTLRFLLAGGALLFIPGYVLTLAVFPESRTERDTVGIFSDGRGPNSTVASLDPVERLALAVGFSVGLMPVYGYVVGLGVPGSRYEPQSTIVLVSATTAVFTILAGLRRLTLPTDAAVPSPFARLVGRIVDETFDPTLGKRILNIVVVAMLVLATVNLAVALSPPAESPEYTTAVLLTETDDGELVADGYPDQLRTGETADLVLRVENHQSRDVNYRVVVQIQRVNSAGVVTEISTLNRFDRTLAPGQAWERDHQVTSEMTGERVRLAYLVYEGEVPSNPSLENSHRHLTLWIGTDDGGNG